MDAKQQIAFRAAQELKDGDIVNLGIGLPTMIPQYLPPAVHITLQSENGFLGLGPLHGEPLPDLVSAGGQPCGIMPGAAFFDTLTSFSIIRGGHVNATILGGLQVDQEGNLANWMVPGKLVPGMGGAMDLVTGAKKTIVAMEHSAKDGSAKILRQCTLPLTARGKVKNIITELAFFTIDQGQLVLEEIAPDITLDELKAKTEADYFVSPTLKTMPMLP